MQPGFKRWLSSKCSKPGTNLPGMPWISTKWASCTWRAFLLPHVFNVKPTSCPSNTRPEALLAFPQKSEGFAGWLWWPRLFKKRCLGRWKLFPSVKFPRTNSSTDLRHDFSTFLSWKLLKNKSHGIWLFDGFTKDFEYEDLERGCLFNPSFFFLLTTESEWRGALWELSPWGFGMVPGTVEEGGESNFLSLF